MSKALNSTLLGGALLASLAGLAPASADTNPMFGNALVQKTSATENKAIVGKGSYADYYGYYGNYYNNLAGYYGNAGLYYKSYSNYYSAYSYASYATTYYYYAYYYQYYNY